MIWQQRAPCAGKGNLFYRGQANASYDEAEALCARCPFLDQCDRETLDAERSTSDIFGYRAGKDPETRKANLRERLNGRNGQRIYDARRALAWQVEGYTIREIAGLLDGVTQRTVERLLADAKIELAEAEEAVAA